MGRFAFTLLALGTLATRHTDNLDPDILAPVPELSHGLMLALLHGEPPLNSAVFLPPPPTIGSP